MKTVRNATARPLRIPLPGGKVLHLGPGKIGQVPDEAERSPSFGELLERGDIRWAEGTEAAATRSDEGPHETAVHGHPQPHRAFTTGNR